MICPEFQLVCKISRPNVAFLLFEDNKRWKFPLTCAPGPADGDVSQFVVLQSKNLFSGFRMEYKFSLGIILQSFPVFKGFPQLISLFCRTFTGICVSEDLRRAYLCCSSCSKVRRYWETERVISREKSELNFRAQKAPIQSSKLLSPQRGANISRSSPLSIRR